MKKLFEKKRYADGKREIFFLGKRIFNYQKKCSKNFPSLQKMQNISDPVKYIRSLGVKVGENCRFIIHPYFFSYPDFGSEPYLIEIGNDVLISFGCVFLTHDGSVNMLAKYYSKDEHINRFGKIKIGNNCFIGCHSIILPGVAIGDDCIIGAGSVVTKNIPSGEVWAGNPAHYIRKTSDLAKKYKDLFYSKEAKELQEYIILKKGSRK